MNRHSRAITLIELAATVAVLAVLAATLAPALGEVRRRGKDTVCLQNLSRIAQASIIYASQDPDEQAIPVHPVLSQSTADAFRTNITTLTYGGKSGRGRWHYNPHYWGTLIGRGPASRPMNQILYKGGFPNFAPPPYGDYVYADLVERATADGNLDLSVYQCPSDSGYTGLHWTQYKDGTLTSYDFFGTSYHANACWVMDCSDRIGSNSAMLRALSQVPNPASTVYYMEHCGRFSWYVEPHPDGCYPDDYYVIGGWHGQPFEFNVSFVDGHVAQTCMRGYESPFLGRYPEYMNPYEGHAKYECVVLRGPGWQLDTLPAPIIWTDVYYDDKAAGQGDDSGALRLLPVPPAPE